MLGQVVPFNSSPLTWSWVRSTRTGPLNSFSRPEGILACGRIVPCANHTSNTCATKQGRWNQKSYHVSGFAMNVHWMKSWAMHHFNPGMYGNPSKGKYITSALFFLQENQTKSTKSTPCELFVMSSDSLSGWTIEEFNNQKISKKIPFTIQPAPKFLGESCIHHPSVDRLIQWFRSWTFVEICRTVGSVFDEFLNEK